MKRRSSARPSPFAARVGHHRQVEDLRLARRQHQHAVGDDPALALADARRIAGGERVAEVADRPRRRVDLRLQRGDVGEIALAQRPPRESRLRNVRSGAWPCACAVRAARRRRARRSSARRGGARRAAARRPRRRLRRRRVAAARARRPPAPSGAHRRRLAPARGATRASGYAANPLPAPAHRAGRLRPAEGRPRPARDAAGAATSRHPSPSPRIGRDVDLAHPRIEAAQRTRAQPCVAKHLLRERRERGHRDHRQVRAERQSLRHAAADANAGERPGTGAERDAVEIARAPIPPRRAPHRPSAAGAPSARAPRARRGRCQRAPSPTATLHHSVEVSSARIRIGQILLDRTDAHAAHGEGVRSAQLQSAARARPNRNVRFRHPAPHRYRLPRRARSRSRRSTRKAAASRASTARRSSSKARCPAKSSRSRR